MNERKSLFNMDALVPNSKNNLEITKLRKEKWKKDKELIMNFLFDVIEKNHDDDALAVPVQVTDPSLTSTSSSWRCRSHILFFPLQVARTLFEVQR